MVRAANGLEAGVKAFRNRQRIANWREDENGLLTITVCVLKEGVYPYGADECEGLPDTLAGRGTVMEFIPAAEFTPEAMKTLEGKPATIMTDEEDAHEWRTPDNAMKDGLTVGAVAGTPWVEGDELRCDLLISDRDAIEAVKRGELAEVSAGYEGEITYGDGTFSGEGYQARQSDFRFNHILLLPSGAARLGPDTRIINKRTTNMAEYTVKQHFKNGARTFRFTNEADKEEAERMANEAAEEAKVSSAEEVENAMKRCNELKEEIEVKNAELEEAKQVIVDYKEQIDKLLDPESQEQLAAELLDQAAAEEEIMESEVDESERDELENRVKNCKLRAGRRKVIVAHVMNKRGVIVDDNWTDEGIGAAFAVLAASAKAKIGNRKPRKAPGSEPVRVGNANIGDPFARMMAFKNRKGDK